jgi:hypothetical protein
MIKQLRWSGGWMVGLALALVVFLGAPGLVPDARAAQYNVSLQAPDELLQYQNAEVVAIVTDSQGRPVNGIPVEFRVAPGWENNVALTPQSISTQNGQARVVFRSDMTGVVYMTAQAGDATATTHITVSGSGSRRGSPINEPR